MSKWKAIKAILHASNYIVITDQESIGNVSPLYADKFIEKLDQEHQRQQLASYKHDRMMGELADEVLGEL